MKKRKIIGIAVLTVWLLLLAAVCAGKGINADKDPVTKENAENFAVLLADLVKACENDGSFSEQSIERDLEEIRSVDRKDYEVAVSIADHWKSVFLDPDYSLLVYHGEASAPELSEAGIPNSRKHALVILGYQLKDGQMQPELIGRLDAAAAAAKALPETIIVCSGGATGENNPEGHTEAGLMRDYLVEHCGVDGKRIFADENAMTTQENAENTLRILQQKRVRSMTIITSTYHQCWGQADYNAIAAIYEQQHRYKVEIIGNYCYEIEPPVEMYKTGYKIAAFQIAGILELPEEAMKIIPSPFPARPPKNQAA